MYLNFSNFGGRTSAGGDKPWTKNGDKYRMGGLAKFSPDGGTPIPPGKNPVYCHLSMQINTGETPHGV